MATGTSVTQNMAYDPLLLQAAVQQEERSVVSENLVAYTGIWSTDGSECHDDVSNHQQVEPIRLNSEMCKPLLPHTAEPDVAISQVSISRSPSLSPSHPADTDLQQVQVLIYRNDGGSTQDCVPAQAFSITMLLETASLGLQLPLSHPAKRLFHLNGAEVFPIEDIFALTHDGTWAHQVASQGIQNMCAMC